MTISVVIPAYNSTSTILAALDSAAFQTVRPDEVIVADDQSQDDTVDVAERWISTHERRLDARVLRSTRNGGPAAARNKGIHAAKGDWIAFLDADDVWLPERLALQMAALERHPNVSMVCGVTVGIGGDRGKRKEERGTLQGAGGRQTAVCRPQTKDQEPRTTNQELATKNQEQPGPPPEPPSTLLTLRDFAVDNPVATSTVLVRRDVLNDAGGFDVQFRGPEDYDLWMRIAAKGEIRKLDVPLARYRHVPGSLSMDDRTFLPQVMRVLDKAFGDGGSLHELAELRIAAESTQLWNASWMAFHRGARRTAVRYLVSSYVKNRKAARPMERKWGALFARYLVGFRVEREE